MTSTIDAILKTPDLRKRIVFTLWMLAIYRLGIFVSTPGVNRDILSDAIGSGGGFLGMFNMFSGGALMQMSVFALGIMPYVTASIILQLLAVVVPSLERMRKEGEQGQRKLNQYTRYGTVVIAAFQGVGIATYLESLNDQYQGLVLNEGWTFRVVTVVSLMAGTAFLMWLGEQINEQGIGNGISVIIFAGIVAGIIPGAISAGTLLKNGELEPIAAVILALIMAAVVYVICYFEMAQRRIPVQYTRNSAGADRKVYSSRQSFLPLKLNMSGVIPPIFASSILMAPTYIASRYPNSPWAGAIQRALTPNDWRYESIFVGLIIFFTYFYTAVTFNPVDIADNMKRSGSFIPGYRPGKKTAEYIDYVVTRLSLAGAVYLAAVCVLPNTMHLYFPVNFYYGGTSLLIVVSVCLTVVQQVEGYLITRHYESITTGTPTRIRDRVGDE